GLGLDLTGPSPVGRYQGAATVLIQASSILVVGEMGASGTRIDLHQLFLNGTNAVLDLTFPLGTSTGDEGQVSQTAMLPDGRVLVGVGNLGVPGPLAG